MIRQLIAGLLICPLLGSMFSVEAAPAARRPNVIFIFTDDHAGIRSVRTVRRSTRRRTWIGWLPKGCCFGIVSSRIRSADRAEP